MSFCLLPWLRGHYCCPTAADSPRPRERRWRRSRLRSGSLVLFWWRAAGGRGGLKLQRPNESQRQEGLRALTQSLRWCTADEGALWSTQWLHAGPPGQDLHPEPAVLLRRDLWWRDRPPMVPQQLSPSSFRCRWRSSTAEPTLND